MTTLTHMAERSPEIIVGENEHRRLVATALTDITQDAERIDFLLYELDRARIMADDRLPFDVVRLGSVVRFSGAGGQRTAKIVVPDEYGRVRHDGYRLSVTSRLGAALLGLRPGQRLSWRTAEGACDWVEVIGVANTPNRPILSKERHR